MEQYISKSAIVAEIEKRKSELQSRIAELGTFESNTLGLFQDVDLYDDILSFIDTLDMKDPYKQCVQYDSIKAGIQEHAGTYSFNIESELFNQLTKEQQKLWRKEIEQACISGGNAGYSLARDRRYKENLEVKEVDSKKEGLTWEDIRELYILFAEIDAEIEFCKCDIQAETIGYYQEVLKRFKARKGK